MGGGAWRGATYCVRVCDAFSHATRVLCDVHFHLNAVSLEMRREKATFPIGETRMALGLMMLDTTVNT